MGCGPSNSANAAVEPLLNNESSAASQQSPNQNNQINTLKHGNQHGTTNTITTDENTRASNFDEDNVGSNEREIYLNGTGPSSTPKTAQYATRTMNSSLPKKINNTEVGVEDPQWRELWLANKDILLDPADVHATLQDLMADATNRLSDTELLFLQRRVRSTVRQSQLMTEQQFSSNGGKNRKKTRRSSGTNPGNSSGNEFHDTNRIAKNHHLLNAHVLKKVLSKPPVPEVKCNTDFLTTNFGNMIIDTNVGDTTLDTISPAKGKKNVSTIKTVETTYLLALFCNDVLWDNVAEIAVDSAKANNLEMDVNKSVSDKKDNSSKFGSTHNELPQIPMPSEPTCERKPQIPLGVGMHALSFILGLALRKYSFFFRLIVQKVCDGIGINDDNTDSFILHT